jgi:dTDP-4-amino-4,6-dideoxygalactose transaminase
MSATSAREIPFARPDFDDAESRAVADVIATRWVSQGPRVARFEELFAERVGAAHAVATSSCTTALHLALLVAGVEPGDEVICPSYTFIATANAVLYAGAAPVFADIDPDTWNIDPDDVMRRVTARTRAVIPVHQVGLAAALDALQPLADRGIAIVEDAACAIGATYRGQPIGSHGHTACWSFHPRKAISTGEGGMLTTDDAAAAERARRLRSFAASVSDHDRHRAKGIVTEEYRELGFNYRMTDVQAAIGIEQLAKLDRLLARRKALARRYDDAFSTLPHVRTPARPADAEHAYQSYGLRLLPGCPVDRDTLLSELVADGISCRRGIAPIHLEPFYRQRCGAQSLPITEEVAARSLFLPLFASLADDDQDRIVDAVVRRLRPSAV